MESSCKVSYKVEESRWTGRRYATLQISFSHPRHDETTAYKRVFEHSWRVDEEYGRGIEKQLLGYALQAVANAQVALEPYVDPKVTQELEKKVVYALATVTDAADIARSYDQDKHSRVQALQGQGVQERLSKEKQEEKERAKRLQDEAKEAERKEQQRLKEHDQQRISLEKGLKEKLIRFEAAAQYKIARTASTGRDGQRLLEYALTQAHVEKNVADYYDPNDNLLSRPVFNPRGLKGWAVFVKEALGDGFYNHVFNAQNDIDDFYLRIAKIFGEEVRQAGSLDHLTEEAYERAIVDNFTLDEVMELFEREKDVEVELLRRFSRIHDVDYTRALQMITSRLQTDRLFYTFTEPGVDYFSSDLSSLDNETDFKEKMARLKGELGRYLTAHEAQIVVGENPNTHTGIDKGKRVITIRSLDASIGVGSVGRVTSRSHNYGWYNNVTFSFLVGEHLPLPHKQERVGDEALRVAVTMKERYGNIESCAESLLDIATTEIVKKIKNPSLTKQQETIKQFHPYLEDEIEFLERSLVLMRERMEEMYARHRKEGDAETVLVEE